MIGRSREHRADAMPVAIRPVRGRGRWEPVPAVGGATVPERPGAREPAGRSPDRSAIPRDTSRL